MRKVLIILVSSVITFLNVNSYSGNLDQYKVKESKFSIETKQVKQSFDLVSGLNMGIGSTLIKLFYFAEILVLSEFSRKKLINYMFVACPEGNGIDTHRFWEALYLNVIPVTTNKNFYSQFENLPILAINKWEDLGSFSEDDLNLFYQKNKHKFKLIKYIWIDYWKKHIDGNFRRNLKIFKRKKNN